MMQRKKIIEELLHSLHTMKRKLMVGYIEKKGLMITPSQGFVLRFVAEHSLTNVKTIAAALHITSSAATQLIDGLVDKGYLIRKDSPQDRRAISLSLSPKAKKMFKGFKEQGLQKMTELFNVLTDEELKTYATLNKKIFDSIDINKSL
ncbi:MAG TPA: MarR family transcriptional regulator [Candidatus Magasanikbacteria bacterium]|nr:MarR family transcriptional regulator [Candidatus Magasanikbacteria bacterium]